MNISSICSAPPNVNDAVGDFSWLLAQELRRAGDNVSIITSKSDGMPVPEELGSVPIYFVTKDWGIQTSKEILCMIQKLNPHVVLVHFVPQLYGWYGAKPFLAILLFILSRRGYKIVTVAHELFVPFGPSPKLMFLSCIHRLILNVIVKSSQKIILTSEDRFRVIAKLFPKRQSDFHKIPIGCPIPVVPVGESSAQYLRQKLGISSGQLVVSTFASIVGSDFAQLKKLLKWIIGECLNVRILIMGKRGEELKKHFSNDPEILNRLFLTGVINNQALLEYLSISDLYIALYEEGASVRRTSLMISLACGIPTISNVGVATDSDLRSSEAVFLIKGISYNHDIEALRHLCKNRALRTQFGKQGQEYFNAHFSWPKLGKQYRQAIHEALPKHG